MYVCIYVCMYVCVSLSLSLFLSLSLYMYIYIYISIYTCKKHSACIVRIFASVCMHWQHDVLFCMRIYAVSFPWGLLRLDCNM